MTGRGLLTTGHCSRASDRSSLAPRPTIVGVRRRCRAPSWVQHCSPGEGAICYEMLRFPVFRPHFRPFCPHPAYGSLLREQGSTHFLAPGKRGSPFSTPPRPTLHASRSTPPAYHAPRPTPHDV